MEWLIVAYEKLFRRWIPLLIGAPLVIMTVVVFLNAVGRKLFVPFPGTIELVEALLVVSVYFGVGLVALEGGHVNVTFATGTLGPRAKRFLDGAGNLLAALAFAYLAVSAWAVAIDSVRILEYRLAVYRFPLWPFKTLFALGLSLLAVQLLINAIKCFYLACGRRSFAGMYSLD